LKKIAIINCGAGNTGSLVNALKYLNYEPVLLDRPEKNYNFSHIILPGVGSFGRCGKNLQEFGFYEYLINNKEKGNFLLGICVGMQLLFKDSEESKSISGLNFIDGNIELFSFGKIKKLPVPHVGFTSVDYNDSPIWTDIPNKPFFYFIHSYRAKKISEKINFATSHYGEKFISFVEKENLFGCQFHPEKSHKNGLKFLNNFCNFE
jgi:glutamine amidotransferase